VSKVSHHDHDDGAELALTFEELAEASRHAPPPTDDDVTVTWDGRVINTKEKLLAWLKEIDAERAAGLTFEQLEARYALDGRTLKAVLDLARTAVGVDVELAEDGLAELRLSTPTRSGLHCTGGVCQRVKRQTQRHRSLHCRATPRSMEVAGNAVSSSAMVASS